MISRFLGDGDHAFHLTFDLAHAFERDQRKSLFGVMRALSGGDWRVDDVAEVIRLSLVGGGMADLDAYGLVETYVKGRPLGPSAVLAGEILEDAFLGEKDPVKEEVDRVFGAVDE